MTSTRAAISGGRLGDDFCQGGEDGLAQAGVEVGLVHGRVLSAGKTGGVDR